MPLTIPGQLFLKPPNYEVKGVLRTPAGVRTRKTNNSYAPTIFFPNLFFYNHNHGYGVVNPRLCSGITCACSDGGGEVFHNPHQDVDMLNDRPSNTGDGYITLFVRMLGLDHDPLDREQAVIALWKYSLGGKQCVDMIMQFQGSVNLTVNLLRSESDAACEAAAGLLRMISLLNMYRELVADSGAIEEINGLLRRSSLSSNVKEQSLCTLWNLSVDEKLKNKIANSDLLPLLIKFLEDEEVRVKEAAGGVLANLALTASNHKKMIEAGVIPKLAMLLKTEVEGSKVIKKEARNALLELAKDEYSKILIIEEGLLLVPLVGAAAYKSFRPALYSWPSLPDGTKIEKNPKPSRYGATELLLGLNIEDNNANIEEEKIKAMVGRTRQQFLARIGAIETEEENKSSGELSSNPRFTLLPWIDGVARLVLILGLEDESAIARAADAIADVSINEHIRVSFKEAGAIDPLVRLINHPSDTVKLAVIRAIERLSIRCSIMTGSPQRFIRRKTTRGASSSRGRDESATPPPSGPQQYGRRAVRTEENGKWFDLHKDDAVGAEPQILEHPLRTSFPQTHQRIIDAGLHFIFQDPGDINVTCVREFYSNWNWESPRTSECRGISILWEPHQINTFLGVPHTRPDEMERLIAHPPYQDIRHTLCGPNSTARWTYDQHGRHLNFPYAHLNREAKVCLKIVCSRLMPTEHLTFISRERVILVFMLMTGRPVNVGHLVHNMMRHTFQGVARRLYYGATITARLHARRVLAEEGHDAIRAAAAPVDVTRVRASGAAAAPTMSVVERNTRDECVLARLFAMMSLQLTLGGHPATVEEMADLELRFPLNDHAKRMLRLGADYEEPLDDDVPTPPESPHEAEDADAGVGDIAATEG